MKNNIVVLILAITTAGQSVSYQSIKVPQPVKTAFNTRFPSATNVRWGKESVKEYEAEFKLNNKPVSANFNWDGSWVETELVIAVAELPAKVKAAINAKYPRAPIIQTEKTEQSGNKILYEVTIKANGKKRGIETHPDGSFAK
jgi:hypothetical protein